jgi:Skp family chaperone for outer membrane proteins
MKFISKPVISAGLVLAAFGTLAAAPAQAQVSGFAVNNPTLVLAQSKTRDTAFGQVSQQYQTQIQLIGTLDTEITALQTTLDTDKNREISQAEIDANPTVVQQVQAKQQQIELATQPIVMAHYYILEQLIGEFGNAQDAVMSEKGITVVLSPDAVLSGPDALYIVDAVTAKLDERMPSVSITVPAGWQPRQSTVNTYEQIQQILMMAAQVRAARAAQATTPGAAPAAAPAVPPTESGR